MVGVGYRQVAPLVGLVLFAGCVVNPGDIGASPSNEYTGEPWWDFTKSESQDRMTVTSVREGLDWRDIEIKVREPNIGFRLGGAAKVFPPAETYVRASSSSQAVEAGDTLQFCAIQPVVQSVQVDTRRAGTQEFMGSWNFESLETWCDDASANPSASTAAPNWQVSLSEADDKLTVTSVQEGLDWSALDIRIREGGIGFRVNSGSKIFPSRGVYTRMASAPDSVQAGDVVRFCAIVAPVQSVQFDIQSNGQVILSQSFTAVETWCDDSSQSPTPTTNPPPNPPTWNLALDEAQDSLTVYDVEGSADWDRLEFTHNAASSLKFRLDSESPDRSGSTAAGTWTRFTSGATAMHLNDHLYLCMTSGTATSVLVEIRDRLANTIMASHTFATIDAACKGVIVSDNLFTPTTLASAHPANVAWKNDGGARHSITIHQAGRAVTDHAKDTDLLAGASTDFTFAEAGTFHVYCKYHSSGSSGNFGSGMVMTITVA